MRPVLIVDDLATEREKLGTILRDAGCQVLMASGGDEAFELAKQHKPSIIFMDIIMPRVDGYATCRRLTQDPETKSIPVVFVSTKHQRADHVWAKMQGGRELIAKPYSDSEVIDALKYAA